MVAVTAGRRRGQVAQWLRAATCTPGDVGSIPTLASPSVYPTGFRRQDERAPGDPLPLAARVGPISRVACAAVPPGRARHVCHQVAGRTCAAGSNAVTGHGCRYRARCTIPIDALGRATLLQRRLISCGARP
jgi:hypothetical protein